MELVNRSLYILLCANLFLCLRAQVTFNPDPAEDVQLQAAVLTPPVQVITVNCYEPTSEPIFKIQYVPPENSEAVFDLDAGTNSTEIKGFAVPGNTCESGLHQYRVILNRLMFNADPILVGGTFRLKVTLNNNTDSSTFSNRTYSFPAPFNLTGSSSSAVLNSEFTWTCHVTSAYPIIEWIRDERTLGQQGYLANGTCITGGMNDTYMYNCQPSNKTYTLTIPGPSLTEGLQASQWRCRDVANEVKGSKFLMLNIVVPVTTVTISPRGSGLKLDADENQTITFTCTTNNNANPPPTILWYIGTSEVTSQAGPNRTTLTLNVTRAEHKMAVKCVAWNSGNTAKKSDSTTLDIRYPPTNNEELQITGYTRVLYENNPATIDISCIQPGGNPVANMTFTCGSQIETNRSTDSEAIRRVSLTNDRGLDGQNCSCVSTHINGYMRSQSFSFIVYYPPGTPTVSISSPFPWKANEGKNLTCNTVPGNPRATTYIWKERESELSTTSQTYIINPLQSSDNGRTLRCQVNNNFTLHENFVLTSANTTLQVLYPPANGQELQIMGYASGQVLYEKNPTVIGINCTQPGGNPVANITFTCASKPGTIGDTTTEAIRRLNLTNDRNLNEQNCTCVSTHISGYRRSKSFSFIVYYPPSTPTIRNSSSFPWKAPGIYNLTCYSNPGNPQTTTYTWIEGGSDLPIKARTY